jgi:dihydrolipoamide dehydrogenase
LGAEETTLLERGSRLLPRTEPFAGDLVAKSFKENGIDVRLDRFPVPIERPVPGGPVTVHTDDGERTDADEILVAAGRRLAVDDVGLEAVGLQRTSAATNVAYEATDDFDLNVERRDWDASYK